MKRFRSFVITASVFSALFGSTVSLAEDLRKIRAELKSENLDVRVSAVAKLHDEVELTPELLPELLNLVRDKTPRVRKMAVNGLGIFETFAENGIPFPKSALSLLIEQLKDPDETIAMTAASVIRRLPTALRQHPALIQRLGSLVNDSNPAVAENALRALPVYPKEVTKLLLPEIEKWILSSGTAQNHSTEALLVRAAEFIELTQPEYSKPQVLSVLLNRLRSPTLLKWAQDRLGPQKSATDCGAEVRLDAPGGTAEKMPIHDQDGLGICFAETGAQLFDSLMNQQGVTHPRTSSLHAALLTKLNFSDPSQASRSNNGGIDGGDPCATVQGLGASGACSHESYLRFLNTGWPKASVGRLYDLFETHRQGLEAELKNKKLQKEIDQTVSRHAFALMDGILATCSPNRPSVVKLPTFDELGRILQEGSFPGLARGVFGSDCQPQDKFRAPFEITCQAIGTYGYSSRQMKPVLQRRLLNHLSEAKSATPVGISYCSALLQKGPDWKKGTQEASDLFRTPECGMHASIVVGKRQKNGSCQFLIRNSWGTDCDSYAKTWECQNGQIWVDADALLENTYELQFVKRAP